mmetsp:Transcript_77992/g.148149  ORF Transcript_77992/g.148149 Transcript_77992/m.148149 type:complete len:499 (-) Transcript_77992:184-1680(-)
MYRLPLSLILLACAGRAWRVNRPAAASFQAPSRGVAPKLTSARSLTRRPRVASITAVADQLATLEQLNPESVLATLEQLNPWVVLPSLAAVATSGISLNLQEQLTKTKAAAEEAASAAKRDLDRVEEEKSALAREMDEQKTTFDNSISNARAEHSAEIDEFQTKLSSVEKEKSTLAIESQEQANRLENTIGSLQTQFDSKEAEVETLQKHLGSAQANKNSDDAVNFWLQVQSKARVADMQAMIKSLAAKIDSVESSAETSIRDLQVELDERTEAARFLQRKSDTVEKEKSALAKEMQTQADNLESNIQNLEAQLTSKEAEAETLQTQLGSAQAEAEQLQVQSQAQIADMQAKINGLETQIDTVESSTKTSIRNLQVELDEKVKEAQHLQRKFDNAEKEKLQLAKELDQQVNVAKKTAVQSKWATAELEKMTAEINILQTKLQAVQKEKVWLAEEMEGVKRRVAVDGEAVKKQLLMLKKKIDLQDGEGKKMLNKVKALG